MSTAVLSPQAPRKPSRSRAAASWVFAAVSVLSGVIAVSVYAPMDDPFESDAQVLIATFGVGMALLSGVIALVPFRRGERWAWGALWIWPAFFVAHLALLGTVVPDLPLALVTTAALVASRP